MPRREVAVTFDDIPGVALQRSERCSVKAFTALNRKLIETLVAHRVPAFGLVTPGGICNGQESSLPGILDMWLDAGFDLGNHSYSHFDINTTPQPRYQSDVLRGAKVVESALRKRGKRLRYFRHPFLHAGKDPRTKDAFEKFLASSGYTVAPVTIDNQEWVFAEVYARAKDRGDKATVDRVASEYLKYMNTIFDFFERRSVEVAGYEIKQVLLLHVNPLNADYLDELIGIMKNRGYEFVSMDEALTDPAYRLPDGYTGPVGLSWIHRWGLAKGMKVREDPREPQIIAKLYRDYTSSRRMSRVFSEREN